MVGPAGAKEIRGGPESSSRYRAEGSPLTHGKKAKTLGRSTTCRKDASSSIQSPDSSSGSPDHAERSVSLVDAAEKQARTALPSQGEATVRSEQTNKGSSITPKVINRAVGRGQLGRAAWCG